jgi:hypothetical protein
LQVHAEIDVVDEELQRPLVLLIAAGRAEHHERLAVLETSDGVRVVRGRLCGAIGFARGPDRPGG